MSTLLTTPLVDRIVPTRGAAKRAAASLTEQLLSSPAGPSNDLNDPPSSPFGEPTQARTKVIRTYIGKARFKGSEHVVRPSQPAPKISTPKPVAKRAPKKKSAQKRALTPSELSDTDQSNLTDHIVVLSSSPASPARKAKARRHTLPHFPTIQEPADKQQPPVWPVTPSSSPSRVTRLLPEKWDIAKLETFVWVLVQKNRGLDKGGNVEVGHVDDGMWWPGKISSRSTSTKPLRVTLFGESSAECSDIVEIHSPSEHNIQPMLTSNGNLRFNLMNHLCPRPDNDVTSSPRKKSKTNIQFKWQSAVDRMLEEYEIDNDGLPTVGLAYSETLYGALSTQRASGTIENAKVKEKKKGIRSVPDLSVGDTDRWSPPPCDPTLMVPGELVLAREPKGTCYWPAMLQGYVPPTNPRDKPKYRVRFLDESKFDIPRESFFTSEEDGFSLCKLGTWESSYKNVVDDVDESGSNEELIRDEQLRKPSPMPTVPISGAFGDLPIEEQFVYTKPVLVAILSEEYPPAKKRHDDFIKGGTARKLVTDTAYARGTIVPEDVDRLQERLLWWALREERRAKKMDDVDDVFGCNTAPGSSTVNQDQAAHQDASVAMDSDIRPDVSPLSPSAIELPPPSSSQATEPRLSQHTDELSSSKEAIQVDITRVVTKDGALSNHPIESVQSNDRQLARQRGCEAYESLSGVEKIEYCSNVLLPEAIIQILLWRSGERHSLELLDVEEEERLHVLGTQKTQETDWVHDVMRLREAKERLQKKRALHTPMITGGTRSRPRRSAAALGR